MLDAALALLSLLVDDEDEDASSALAPRAARHAATGPGRPFAAAAPRLRGPPPPPLIVKDRSAFDRFWARVEALAREREAAEDAAERADAAREGRRPRSRAEREAAAAADAAAEARRRRAEADAGRDDGPGSSAPLLEARFDSSKNYYAILSVHVTSTSQEIRTAYRRCCLRYHPDKLSPDAGEQQREEAVGLFRESTEAHDCLSNELQRRAYDAARARGERGGPAAARAARAAREAAELERRRRAAQASAAASDKSTMLPPTVIPVPISCRQLQAECTLTAAHARRRFDAAGLPLCETQLHTIVVPAGARHGQRFTIAGAGDAPAAGSPCAELVLELAPTEGDPWVPLGAKGLALQRPPAFGAGDALIAVAVPVQSAAPGGRGLAAAGAGRSTLIVISRVGDAEPEPDETSRAAVRDGRTITRRTWRSRVALAGHGLPDAAAPHFEPPGNLLLEATWIWPEESDLESDSSRPAAGPAPLLRGCLVRPLPLAMVGDPLAEPAGAAAGGALGAAWRDAAAGPSAEHELEREALSQPIGVLLCCGIWGPASEQPTPAALAFMAALELAAAPRPGRDSDAYRPRLPIAWRTLRIDASSPAGAASGDPSSLLTDDEWLALWGAAVVVVDCADADCVPPAPASMSDSAPGPPAAENMNEPSAPACPAAAAGPDCDRGSKDIPTPIPTGPAAGEGPSESSSDDDPDLEPPSPARPRVYLVRHAKVLVRTAPSTAARPIDLKRAGEAVSAVERRGGWVRLAPAPAPAPAAQGFKLATPGSRTGDPPYERWMLLTHPQLGVLLEPQPHDQARPAPERQLLASEFESDLGVGYRIEPGPGPRGRNSSAPPAPTPSAPAELAGLGASLGREPAPAAAGPARAPQNRRPSAAAADRARADEAALLSAAATLAASGVLAAITERYLLGAAIAAVGDACCLFGSNPGAAAAAESSIGLSQAPAEPHAFAPSPLVPLVPLLLRRQDADPNERPDRENGPRGGADAAAAHHDAAGGRELRRAMPYASAGHIPTAIGSGPGAAGDSDASVLGPSWRALELALESLVEKEGDTEAGTSGAGLRRREALLLLPGGRAQLLLAEPHARPPGSGAAAGLGKHSEDSYQDGSAHYDDQASAPGPAPPSWPVRTSRAALRAERARRAELAARAQQRAENLRLIRAESRQRAQLHGSCGYWDTPAFGAAARAAAAKFNMSEDDEGRGDFSQSDSDEEGGGGVARHIDACGLARGCCGAPGCGCGRYRRPAFEGLNTRVAFLCARCGCEAREHEPEA